MRRKAQQSDFQEQGLPNLNLDGSYALKFADILIVDDEPQVTKLIGRELDVLGYQITSAVSGIEALNLASETQFKVVISDVKMNNMDGFELLDRIHELNPMTTRIILSGHSDVKLILKLVNEMGIDRYVEKPWKKADLILAIGKCIELYDLRSKVDDPSILENSKNLNHPATNH